jgi:hypothetical protein
MKTLRECVQEALLHHAYGVKAGAGIVHGLLKFFEENLGVATIGNPDFFLEEFETLSIADTRRIREIYAGKAFIP